MNHMIRQILVIVTALVPVMGTGVQAREPSTPPKTVYASGQAPASRRAFFGELHLHTAMSFDAWTFGTKLLPDQAYKFGRGETVMVPAVQVQRQEGVNSKGEVPARRAWPLDFMAVTDHSESMGVLTQLDNPDNALAKTPLGQRILSDPASAFFLIAHARKSGKASPFPKSTEVMQHAWQVEVEAANANYQPGKFTTFIAYEWSATAKDRSDASKVIGSIHRNIIFNSDHAPMPFTSVDSDHPENLWAYLEKTRANGIDVIAIPHNGNLSGGMMYDWNDSDGRPISEEYAQRRALNEPLTEIAQNKGQSETAPTLSPSDEFANFEIYDRLLVNKDFKSHPDGSYIRQAFGRGLAIQAMVGVNPYKYGLVGASDIHNGLSTSLESGMASEAFGIDPRTMTPRGDAAKRALGIIKTPAPSDPDETPASGAQIFTDVLKYSSPGITGVWAEVNTRNSIFAALKRKETFATSGTRIRVRMFGGWTFNPNTAQSQDWVAKAYAEGVPMGGDLPSRPRGASAPRFILQAIKDPDGANLDRIQVIKVWTEGKEYKEKIFNIALSGSRKPNAAGRVRPVGDTVDLKTGAYKNSIGAASLTATWKDPEFDPARAAVYYARVLEIPTPRWSTLLAVHNHLPIPKAAPATIQERAWTSPIWYTPQQQQASNRPAY